MRVLTNFLDYEMDLQEALDGGRSFSFGGMLDLEPTIPEKVAAELSALGHNVRYTDYPSRLWPSNLDRLRARNPCRRFRPSKKTV